jgi:hypothetical protein
MSRSVDSWLTSGWRKTDALNAAIASRQERFGKIYAQGGATSQEFIEADFGTPHPQGLEIEPWPDRYIHIQSIFKSPVFENANPAEKIKNLRWGGWVQRSDDNKIYLNPLFYSTTGQRVFHTLAEIRGRRPRTHADILPHEFVHSQQVRQDHTGWIGSINKTCHHLRNAGLNGLSPLRRTWRQAHRAFLDVDTVIRKRTNSVQEYYARPEEMQARLHEILANGYMAWGRLPTNKIEFWAALKETGIKPPEAIARQLTNTQEGQTACSMFKVPNTLKPDIASEVWTFNRILDYAGEEKLKENIWDILLPSLYGELIEFYGDKPGRARMGLGENPRPMIEALHKLVNAPAPISEDECEAMATSIPKGYEVIFINSLIKCHQNAEPSSPARKNSLAVVRKLLEHPDIRSVLFQDPLQYETAHGIDARPPLLYALTCGDQDMARILTKAGADPFQKYEHLYLGEKMFELTVIGHVDSMLREQRLLTLTQPQQQDMPTIRHWQKHGIRKAVEEHLDLEKSAFAAVFECYPHPDQKRSIMTETGNDREITLREYLAPLFLTGTTPVHKWFETEKPAPSI